MASRRALNPAFASAHGLETKKDEEVLLPVVDTTNKSSGSKRLELILRQAKTTGKLHACNASLKSPLPDSLFDFRSGSVVDLSMDSSSKTSNNNETFLFAEETLTSVDLSDNDMHGDELDPRVLRYEQLQVLRWKRCGLTTINVNLSTLQQLIILDLAGNRLEIFQLDLLPSQLQELNLANNQLREISSKDLVLLNQLLSIDISENQLEQLSLRVSWPRLKSFRCSYNQLKELPVPCLESATNSLQTLDATHNHLQGNTTALDLSKFSKLQTVLLSSNRLTVMPNIPSSVVRLDLTTNRIKSIQGMLSAVDCSEIPALVELSLQDNYLAELDPNVIGKCTNLQRLDLSSNKLKTLPYQLGLLENLRHLTVTGNPLYTFKDSDLASSKTLLEKLRNRAPVSDDTPTHKTLLSSSSVLRNKHSIQLSCQANINLQQQLVSELQASPIVANDITQLIMDKNQLDQLSDELLALLPNLSEISLCGNAFKTFPLSLATSCQKLTRLKLSHNAICDIHTMFFTSKTLPWTQTLTHLDLSSNRLTHIPGTFWKQLPNLHFFSLSFNQLKSIQDWNWLPPTLTHLDLSENHLEEVDQFIWVLGAFCSNLEILLLPQNYIRCIPPPIGLLHDRCPKLTVLDLKGNPQHAIRPEILAKSTKDQLEYLKHRMTDEQISHALSQFEITLRTSEVGEGTGGSGSVTTSLFPSDSVPMKLPSQCNDGDGGTGDGDGASNVDEMSIVSNLQIKILELEKQLESPSLSQAKRYAVKKELAMERSKLIREERKLGLRK